MFSVFLAKDKKTFSSVGEKKFSSSFLTGKEILLKRFLGMISSSTAAITATLNHR